MEEKSVLHLYRSLERGKREVCFNIEMREPLSDKEANILFWLLAETFDPNGISLSSFLEESGTEIEVGPRLNFATPWNTNALSILKSCGLDKKITRLEMSRRVVIGPLTFDRMTEYPYPEPLTSFATGKEPDPIYEIPLKEEGLAAFGLIEGSSMDQRDKQAYYDYFVGQLNRNPTIVEIMDLNNANSEHSRHGYFKGKQVIDGVEMPETLMEIVKSTLAANPSNSLVAFRDNSSVIKGYRIRTLVPEYPGQASKMVKKEMTYHFLFTAETHNFPTGVAPFPGAQTGTGGRIRDVQATGRGGLPIAGTAGYAVGNLLLDGYILPWEKKSLYPDTLASAKEIIIRGSDGASDYGNQFGEPVIQGFVRSGASYLPNGTRYEFLKPILFTGGIGQIDGRHLEKEDLKEKEAMLIVQIGGPAYRIGFGGGAASSLMQGENKSELDFNAVQRGDAEMEQKMNRVVRACVEMGDFNPIVSIHDQGAGGPANVLKELVEKYGGKIDVRKIAVGDPTLSVLEIWVAEFQERNGLLIRPKDIVAFQAICAREKVNCELLGEVTWDGIFIVEDSLNPDSNPVEMELEKVLGGMPQKTFFSETIDLGLEKLNLPDYLEEAPGVALLQVLRLPSVGSKRFLTNKVDRSVTGLIARQQCCGWPQLTVSDHAIVAQSHFPDNQGKYTGAAISIGEQPIKMLVDPAAGARMAVAEMLTNLAGALVSDLSEIKCSANWMGAPKLPGEGVRMYRAATAMRDVMVELGIAIDGGKDSLSMATKVPNPDGSVELVKSPLELVISAYCSMPDITKSITPDIKCPGESRIMRIDLANGKRRLGGSALAQVYSQLGDECPDIDDPQMLGKAFRSLQEMIGRGLILSCHDISDGGMIVSLLEMLFSGNCGFIGGVGGHFQAIEEFFAEEAGWLVEYSPKKEEEIIHMLQLTGLDYEILGQTTTELVVKIFDPFGSFEPVIDYDVTTLRGLWEESSYQLEKLQCNPDCAKAEKEAIANLSQSCPYQLSFVPKSTLPELLSKEIKPKVAIIREEGSNGDREMASYFEAAGFETWDVNMVDLIKKKVDLQDFRGLAFVGGFSYADVLDSAKGWAATILFNKEVREMFDDFYHRPDTFSLSVCNGCQLAALLGWVPVETVFDHEKIRFIKNRSGRFESRFSTVKVMPSPAIMLRDMAGSVMGIWCAHGEGQLHVSDQIRRFIVRKQLAPLRFVDDEGLVTEGYPFNPNGSAEGITAVCDPSGRHLAMMPHPERSFLKWQWAYMPEDWKRELEASPWLKLTQNAYDWCIKG